RGGEMALLSRARPDQPQGEMRTRNHHGQTLLQRVGSTRDVRLHADYGRLRLHYRIPDRPRLARRPVEHPRRRPSGNHERNHRERRKSMKTPYQNLTLPQIYDEAESIAVDAKALFGHLKLEQLNWKPSADSWSVSQCLEHLISSNQAYDPVLDRIL